MSLCAVPFERAGQKARVWEELLVMKDYAGDVEKRLGNAAQIIPLESDFALPALNILSM